MKKIYVVRLPKDERQQLEGMLKARKASALKLTRARILLKADQQDDAPAYTDAEIAEALDVSPKTVFNIRRKWVELGLEQALERKQQDTPSRQRKLDGKAEAKLVATCCGPPPKGRAAWTLRLLADQVVELGLASSISPETVRQTLKKRNQTLVDTILVSTEEARRRVRVAYGRRVGRLRSAV
jgi:transposase